MAISYSIDLEAKIQVSELLSLVNSVSGIPQLNNKMLRDPVSDFTGVARLEDDLWCIEHMEKEFRFSPYIHLGMRYGKKTFSRNETLMLTVTTGLLKNLECDMVLQYGGGIVVLQRISGLITFNSYWNDMPVIEYLTEAGLTYDVVRLANE